MIRRKVLKKWTFIAVLCAAHSFFWGVMTKANPVAMVLGLATIILMFTVIESSAVYQSRRSAAPRLARALDWGVRFRVYLALYICAAAALNGWFSSNPIAWRGVSLIAALPYMLELVIGIFALEANQMLTGFDLGAATHPLPAKEMAHFISSYSTTVIVGLMHTAVLGVICLIAYGVIRLREKWRMARNADTSQQP